MVSGAGVGTFRMTGAGGMTGVVATGGGENRGTGGRTGAGSTRLAPEGDGRIVLATTGAAGAGGVEITIGRERMAAAGAGGVARCGIDGEGAAGLLTRGGLAAGKPITVRLSGGRAVPGAGAEAVG